MSCHAGLLVLVVACSTPKPAPRPEVLARPPNHCAAVADRFLAIEATRKAQVAPAMATAFHDVVVERCTQDVWSAAVQDCIVAPSSDVEACMQRLAPEQRDSVAEAVQAKLNEVGKARTK